jgi:hypothetical protein
MHHALSYVASAAIALSLTGGAAAQEQSLPDLSDWHEASQTAAKEMVDKYGQPNGVTDTMLVWHDNGPWERTIIYKEAVEHNFPTPHPDVLEQTISYDVPVEMFDDLAEYDGSVIAERTKGVISARCDKEGANFLAINLAHDIISGDRSVEEARSFYADTMQAVMAGEEPGNPEYLQGFIFEVPKENISNPDEVIFK